MTSMTQTRTRTRRKRGKRELWKTWRCGKREGGNVDVENVVENVKGKRGGGKRGGKREGKTWRWKTWVDSILTR